MPLVSMTINGERFSDNIKSNMLLSDYLRETLDLTGTHVGCDTSQCGACNITVNGDVIKSCSMFVVEAHGSDIVTIEGVHGKDGSLHIIQDEFRKNHGLQCGFCTPGIVMTSIELLNKHIKPSEKQIRDYLQGNICRCTGYQNIVKSIQAAAELLSLKMEK